MGSSSERATGGTPRTAGTIDYNVPVPPIHSNFAFSPARVVMLSSLPLVPSCSSIPRSVARAIQGGVLAVLLIGGLAVARPVQLQSQTRGGGSAAALPRAGDAVVVLDGSALRAAPRGEIVATASRALPLTVDSVRNGFVRVTIAGEVRTRDLRMVAGRARAAVTNSRGTALRGPLGGREVTLAMLRRTTVLFPPTTGARFPQRPGVGLDVVRGVWVDASRVRSASASRSKPAQTSPSAPPSNAPAAASDPRPAAAPSPATPRLAATGAEQSAAAEASETEARLELRSAGALRSAPDGPAIASVVSGAPVSTVARADGWVRVRIEGWLPDSMVALMRAGAPDSLSAADLRADPAGARGRLVRWTVEAVAVRRNDGLRQGLRNGETYLLARGPGTERAVLYLALPEALVATVSTLPPLTTLTVVARVRTGRSEPAGVPVLEVIELGRDAKVPK